nr:hypothetical protein [Tanacetum cinerariifolium]
MGNLSQKRRNSSDVDDFDAIRVSMEDKESKESDKELNKGVFGSVVLGAKIVVDSVELEGEGRKGQYEILKAENGEKVVIFDEELVKEGSEKWKYIVCGYFVRCRMGINELRNEEGMNYVIDQSPWLVNDKPLLINAEDESSDKIEINYVDDKKNVKSNKWVKVDYTWKPDRCNHFKVFGHSVYNYDRKPKLKPLVHNIARPIAGDINVREDKKGFVDVLSRKNNNRRVWNKENQGNEQQPVGVKVAYRPKVTVDKTMKDKQNMTKQTEGTPGVNKGPKVWNVGQDNVTELRKSANKYVVLSDDENNNEDMESSDEEDVFKNIDQATQSLIADEIMGKIYGNALGEKVQIYAILETHLKTKSISKACDYVFGRWRWVSNVAHSLTSYRIVVGWNGDDVDVMVVQSRSQTIFCLVEIAQTKEENVPTWSNDPQQPRWHHVSSESVAKLNLLVEVLDDSPYLTVLLLSFLNSPFSTFLMGDFNVTLKPEEYSNGSSSMTIDMSDFKYAANTMEVEDICSTGISKKKKSFRFANYVADKKDFLDVVREVNVLKEKLKDAQSKVDADPFNLEKRKNAVSIMNEYSQVAEDELKLLHQKAKVRWLEEGDKNTSYFHNIIKTRKHKSKIETICCEDGKRVEGNQVNAQFVNHFHTFLGTSYPISPLNSIGDIAVLKLFKAEANDMIKDVSDKDIKDALFDINSTKAAGPDGHIQDTILITQELLKGYNRKKGPKRCAMKIDIQKAYDTINWDFLKEVLLMVGFHETMVNSIMTYIIFASFSICINGEISGFFKGGRGLRQGDLISPYLFTLVMEVFNMIMIKNIRDDAMHQYWASIYILPLTVINELKKNFQRFLWNPRGSVKRKTIVAWKFVCRLKSKEFWGSNHYKDGMKFC